MDSARTLSENLARLLRSEHHALTDFLVALADFDQRRSWAELRYASLFEYLRRELGVSAGSAQYRKVAAELIQKVPAVVEPLRDGRLCFTTIIEAAKVVTPENCETVLPRFYGLSRREALEVVAALQPHPSPPARTVITAARPAAARGAASVTPSTPVEAGGPDVPTAPTVNDSTSGAVSTIELRRVPPSAAPCVRPAEVAPLTADQRRLHATISAEFARKLAQAQDLRPSATIEEILEGGLDLFLAKAAKQKGLVDRPQEKIRPSNDDDHVPTHVRRAVWKRDQGRCQWRLPNGEICGCTRDLQLDHIEPRALGGKSTVDNCRLLCRRHNIEAARRIFGDAVMDRYTRKPRRRTEARPRLRRATAPPTG